MLLLAVIAAAASAAEPSPPAVPDRQAEVQLETGLAVPLGDLGAGFAKTARGLGAEHGYHLGLRLHFYPDRRLVIAPAFAYVEFGDYDGLTETGKPLEIRAAVLRYGLDALYLEPAAAGRPRLFAGGGVAVARNKYRELVAGGLSEYRADVFSVVCSLTAGVRLGDWSAALQYDINRFKTASLSSTGERLPYSWHCLLLRVGYILPRL